MEIGRMTTDGLLAKLAGVQVELEGLLLPYFQVGRSPHMRRIAAMERSERLILAELRRRGHWRRKDDRREREDVGPVSGAGEVRLVRQGLQAT